MILNEKTISTEKIYNGSIISLEKLLVELPDNKHAIRDIVRHPGAAAVLPIDEDGSVYMVRQYRKPIEKVSLEIPAGRLEPNELPVECAARELSEETGLTSGNLTHILSISTTPAFCDETIHIFLATDLKEGSMHTDEDEFLTREKIHIDKLYDMVTSGEITDSKTIAAVLLCKLKRNITAKTEGRD
jgi:ADP-ribose pyrophosphatase